MLAGCSILKVEQFKRRGCAAAPRARRGHAKPPTIPAPPWARNSLVPRLRPPSPRPVGAKLSSFVPVPRPRALGARSSRPSFLVLRPRARSQPCPAPRQRQRSGSGNRSLSIRPAPKLPRAPTPHGASTQRRALPKRRTIPRFRRGGVEGRGRLVQSPLPSFPFSFTPRRGFSFPNGKEKWGRRSVGAAPTKGAETSSP